MINDTAPANKDSFLSILIPIYNEEECILPLYNRLCSVIIELSCPVEFLFVNDGSTDNSLDIISNLKVNDKRISYLDLSRNFGKEIAMSAGINYIKGNILVIIDADLQDPPELIPEMLKGINEGYDDVYACRKTRKGESWLKKWTSKTYYKWMQYLSNIPIQENTGDFRMFSSKAISALRALHEKERNMKGLFSYIGFRKKPIYYDRDKRITGETKWSYVKLVELAIKGLTSFSVLPLRLVSLFGFMISICAFVYLITVIIKALIWGEAVIGYPSLMSVMLFVSGIMLLALGIIGEYLGIIFNETKSRPLYHINEYSSAF